MTSPAHEGDMPEHWVPIGLLGANASFQRAAREYAEEYARAALSHSLALAADQPGEAVAWRYKKEPGHGWAGYTERSPSEPTEVCKNGWGNAGHWKIYEPLYADPQPPTAVAAVRAMTEKDRERMWLWVTDNHIVSREAFDRVVDDVERFHGIAPPVGERIDPKETKE